MFDACEEASFFDGAVLHHEHAVFDGEEFVEHPVDEEETTGWLVDDAVLEERKAGFGVDFHFFDRGVAEFYGEDLCKTIFF